MTQIACDLITLGEALLRYSPEEGERLESAPTLRVWVGGAELNVAVSCAGLGMQAAWIGKLPNTPLGHRVSRYLAACGVRAYIVWAKDPDVRMGVYYAELGRSPRPTYVLYDRQHSAASALSPEELDWSLLNRTRWVHLTGITPALSASCREGTLELLRRARAVGVPTSFDVNYRSQLWRPEQARPVLESCLEQAEVIVLSQEDACVLWDLPGDEEAVLNWVVQRFQPRIAVLTLGERGAIAQQAGKLYRAVAYAVETLDPIGSGDAFMAGLLFGLLNSKDLSTALDYATAMAALKRTFRGDHALISLQEVEALRQRKPFEVRR